ncbi:hypothetical protein BDV96DRAFT_170388 [Lophiotrema nucula]|uniref:FAD dependent oxidoreductase domain-containing protein n=1 Tax=Lophiotrema nucula TaxID=690887 RepID=A0A6A5YZ88_9PLEO|nr:hypothetical protein BDV96DRAFT_170388 [Lophiotrema nucula]
MTSQTELNFLVLGAGVVGLTSSLVLRQNYPSATITVVAKHLPGDRSIEYTSPWAGANWASMANDSGAFENDDRVTFHKFSEIAEKRPEAGVGRMPMKGYFDSPIEKTGILSPATGKVWYEDLVGGMKTLSENELPEGAVFGVEFASTFRINTQVYLNWLQNEALSRGVKLVRRAYPSLTTLLSDFPTTTLLVNASALGSLKLEDVKDTNVYPTRGQTVLVAEPKTPITKMYEAYYQYFRSPKRLDPTTSYVFPRPLGGGVILGGSRQDGDWNAEVDAELAKDIMERCCALCPELGKPGDLQIISHNVGLRPSRKGGVRIELEKGKWSVPVVHNYGHSGAGYQSSWGTAERAVRLVKKALNPGSKL